MRDFKNPDDFGGYGTESGNKYYSQQLDMLSKDFDGLLNIKNELNEIFESINTYLLPHPGHKVADRNSFKGYVKDIRPVFREEVKRMTDSVLNSHVLKPKMVNGKEVTCKKMMDYIRVNMLTLFDF